MSVLIKDMEMPESCYYCPFSEGSWGSSPPHDKWCLISSKHMPVDGRGVQQNMVSCPLVEIPTPHGDLIDKKILMKELEKRWNVSDDHDFADKEVWHGIEATPIVIPAEREQEV